MNNESAPQQTNALHFLDYWRVIRSRKEIVLAVALLVIIIGVGYSIMLPPMYRADARIRVSEDNPEISPFAAQQSYYSSYNPYFLRTEFEILQSKPILYDVIRRMELQKTWGKNDEPLREDFAYNMLKRSISVFQQRDTSLIFISVTRGDADEAANIANMLAEVYSDKRLEKADKESRRALEQIEIEISIQRKRVDDAESVVEKLRFQHGIALIGGEESIDAQNIRLQQLENDRQSAQRDMVDKQSQLNILKDLSDESLSKQASYLTYDRVVGETMREIQSIDQQLSALRSDFGENHPDVQRAKSQRQEAEEILKRQIQSLRDGLEGEYLRAKSNFDNISELLIVARNESIDAMSEKFRPFRNAQEDLKGERFIYDQLKAKYRQEFITREIPRNPVEIVDRAEPINRPVSPNLILNVMLSILVGLGAGIGIAYFIEYLDTSIKSADDVERLLGLPVLGLIPQKVRPLVEEGPDSEHAEAYRVLRTNLAFTEGGSYRGAFCVLSAGAGEGKSTTVFNMAYVSAQQGEKVLLIDADLRRPVQHTILGVSNRFGLTNVLLRDVPVEEAIKATSVPNLHFLPSGRLPRTSLGILDPKRIGELIASLKTKYDLVLIDTPPLVGISDSSIIAKEADGAILVVQYRKYPRDMLIKAKKMMTTLDVKVVGVVLNNINVMRDDYYYYYHSYSSDYYRTSQSDMSAEDVT